MMMVSATRSSALARPSRPWPAPVRARRGSRRLLAHASGTRCSARLPAACALPAQALHGVHDVVGLRQEGIAEALHPRPDPCPAWPSPAGTPPATARWDPTAARPPGAPRRRPSRPDALSTMSPHRRHCRDRSRPSAPAPATDRDKARSARPSGRVPPRRTPTGARSARAPVPARPEPAGPAVWPWWRRGSRPVAWALPSSIAARATTMNAIVKRWMRMGLSNAGLNRPPERRPEPVGVYLAGRACYVPVKSEFRRIAACECCARPTAHCRAREWVTC